MSNFVSGLFISTLSRWPWHFNFTVLQWGFLLPKQVPPTTSSLPSLQSLVPSHARDNSTSCPSLHAVKQIDKHKKLASYTITKHVTGLRILTQFGASHVILVIHANFEVVYLWAWLLGSALGDSFCWIETRKRKSRHRYKFEDTCHGLSLSIKLIKGMLFFYLP